MAGMVVPSFDVGSALVEQANHHKACSSCKLPALQKLPEYSWYTFQQQLAYPNLLSEARMMV